MLTSLPHNGILIIFKEKQYCYFGYLGLSTIWKCILKVWPTSSQVVNLPMCSSWGVCLLPVKQWEYAHSMHSTMSKEVRRLRGESLQGASSSPGFDMWRQTCLREALGFWRRKQSLAPPPGTGARRLAGLCVVSLGASQGTESLLPRGSVPLQHFYAPRLPSCGLNWAAFVYS